MYFYKIEVYYPYGKINPTIMSHDYYFDNYQLNIIVQQAFDECIEKYTNKTILNEGEEPCRIAIETIFEKYLPTQLQNHGFNNIKIDEVCSIMDGELFANGGAINNVLKNRYKDKALPPCKKCIKGKYDECTVPNIRKDSSLPTTRVVKTIPINLNGEEENKDDFNITILKQYFINFKKSIGKIKIAVIALDDFFDSHDFDDYWIDRDIKVGSEHEGDIFCGFDLYTYKEEFKKLLEDYGFVLEDDEDGFWIIGVKE